MDELTNPYFSEEISGYLTIAGANQLLGEATIYVNQDFKIMKEQNLCGVCPSSSHIAATVSTRGYQAW